MRETGGSRIVAVGLFCLLWVLFGGGEANAASVDVQQAEKAVANWVYRDGRAFGAKPNSTIQRAETTVDSSGEPVYHVVYLSDNGITPDQFVIVSGDDESEPVIAFCTGSQFDPSTDNPLGALVAADLPARISKVRKDQANGIQADGASPRGTAKKRWDSLTRTVVAAGSLSASGASLDTASADTLSTLSDIRVSPLITSKWDQLNVGGAYCYNYYTPNHYYSGCAATALGQVMRYFQYPVSAVGTQSNTVYVDGISRKAYLRGGNGTGGVYQWANMVLSPTTTTTSVQRAAIGALLYDCGVSLSMCYSGSGSAAVMLDAADALVDTFGYGNAIKGYNEGSDFGVSLKTFVNPNLDARLPVLLAVFGSPGGHAIVCDGYGYNSQTLYHHLNMGWSGSYDAWYALPTINSSPGPFTTISQCVYNVYVSGSGEIVSGRILDSAGKAVSGAVVTATTSSGSSYTATTGASGIYALKQLPSSKTYTLSIVKTGKYFASRSVSVGYSTNNSATSGNRWGVDFTEGVGPNLTGYQPSNWADKLIVSTGTGTYVDSAKFLTTDTIYINTAVINNGGANVSGTFTVSVYVDGTARLAKSVSSLTSGSYWALENASIGALGSGTHTIKVMADSGLKITESDETDNSFSKAIVVTAPVSVTRSQLISTGFDSSEGISSGTGVLADGWDSFYSAGYGIISSGISGRGQSAYVGMSGTSISGIYYEFNYTPRSADVLTFDATVELVNTHGQELYCVDFTNQDSQTLFSIVFSRGMVGAFNDVCGLTYSNDTYKANRAYKLHVIIDFGANQWTATLDGAPIFINRPIVTTSGHALDLGQLKIWGKDAPSPGGGYLLIDDISFTKDSMISNPWTGRSSGVSGTLTAAVYGLDRFVAVGGSGALLSSTDGVSWTAQTSGCSDTFYGIAYGNGTYVAVGDNGKIVTSADGVTWTQRTSSYSGYLYSVCYGNSRFVAVGDNGTVLVSSDGGASWSSQTVGNGKSLYSVGYGRSKYVAVGSGGTILTSSNGTTWTQRTSGITGTLNAVACDGTNFVAAGDGGVVLKSEDYGASWSSQKSSTTQTLRGLVYSGDAFTAVGDNGTFLTSKDGDVWEIYTLTGTGNYRGVAFRGGITVAVGENGSIMTSGTYSTYAVKTAASPSTGGTTSGDGAYVSYTSGTFSAAPSSGFAFRNWTENGVIVGDEPTYITTVTAAHNLVANFAASLVNPWTAQTIPNTLLFKSVAFQNNLFVATGYSGAIATSLDCVTWTTRSSGTTAWLNSAAYGNQTFVVVGKSGAALTSPDGAAWTGQISGTGVELNSVVYGCGTFVAVGGSGSILTSPDGIAWTGRTSGTDDTLNSVTYGNNTFVTVGDSGTILSSSNGVTWTARKSGSYEWLNGVTFAKGLFVAVGGFHGTILTSTNGVTWTARATGMSTSLYSGLNSVTYGNNLFMAVGDDGVFLSSTNGTTWTSYSRGGSNLSSVAYGNGVFGSMEEWGSLCTTTRRGTSIYSVTVSASPSGKGTVSGGANYIAGGTATLKAVPATDYLFSSWTDGAATVSTSATYSFPVSSNRTLTANFIANTNLSGLDLVGGGFSPAFSSGTTGYGTRVAKSVSSVKIVATRAIENASLDISVNGGDYASLSSGSESAEIPLNVGVNTVNIRVTAQDGSTKVYTLTVTRGANNANLSSLSATSNGVARTLVFSATATSGTLAFSSGTSVTLTPALSDTNATVELNFNKAGSSAITNQTATDALPLKAGTNTALFKVTAEDQTFSKIYTVSIVRALSADATLSKLSLVGGGTLVPVFAPSKTSYTATVANSATTASLLAAVNEPYASLSLSIHNGPYASIASGVETSAFGLLVGVNTAKIKVVSSNGTAKVYTVIITRLPSSDATLASAAFTAGGSAVELSPAFDAGTLSYSAAIAHSGTVAALASVSSEPNAKIAMSLNGGLYSTAVTGTAKASLMLKTGTNTLAVKVTAQDAKTVKNYVFKLIRAYSSDASLKSLSLKAPLGSIALDPVFAPATTPYSANVAYMASSFTMNPVKSDTEASITYQINGGAAKPLGSGVTSPSLALAVGTNTLNVNVKAGDGTAQTYSVVINRVAAPFTDVATGISGTMAALNATVGSGVASVAFDYGTTTAYGKSVTATTSAADGGLSATGTLAGLAPATIYHYRVVTTTNGLKDYGTDKTFVTAPRVPTTLIVAQGDPAPGMPANAVFSGFGIPALNNHGEAAFLASAKFVGSGSSNNTGIWFWNGSTPDLVVRTGTAIADVGTYTSLGEPELNNNGQIAFLGKLGSVTTLSTIDSGGVIAKVAQVQGTAADTVAKFASFKDFVLPDEGSVAYVATLGTGGTVSVANNQGIWIYSSAGSSRLAVRTGEQFVLDSGSATTLKAFSIFDAPAAVTGQTRHFDESGNLLVIGSFANGTAGVFEISLAELEVSPVTTATMAIPGNAGAKVIAYGNPIMNKSGLTVVPATLSGTAIRSSNNSVLLSIDTGGTATLVAQTGTAAPGGSVFASFTAPVLNNADDIAFLGTLTSGLTGIWTKPASGALGLLARTQGTVADVTGAKFSALSQLVLPDQGGAVFVANLVLGTGGVTALNDSGIWAVDTNGQLRLIIRKGDAFDIDGTAKTISALSLFSPAAETGGQTRNFNRSGDLIFRVTFTDSTQALFLIVFE